MRGRSMRRVLVPATGAVAAAAVVSGWAPVAQSAPGLPQQDDARGPAADSADGTYESCGAYFGFGKSDYGVLDVVEFDVVDQNGADGVAHAVPADTQVVLELTNESGDVMECAAVEVSEADWGDAMLNTDLWVPEGGTEQPGWPGPGHYAYPSVPYGPEVADFGTIVDVAFKVVGIPDGHTLVSPTGTVPLIQHQVYAKYDIPFEADPRVLDLIAADAGAAAADGFDAAMVACDSQDEMVFTEDMVDGINALLAYRGFPSVTADEASCWSDVAQLNHEASFLVGLYETVDYVEQIVLAVPDTATPTTPTNPSTTTTTQPVIIDSGGATPIPGSPTYAG